MAYGVDVSLEFDLAGDFEKGRSASWGIWIACCRMVGKSKLRRLNWITCVIKLSYYNTFIRDILILMSLGPLSVPLVEYADGVI